jgi:YspA, cpYpsA-related SLOG family
VTVAIIAGGRDLVAESKYYQWLDKCHEEYVITEVVSGGAKGADWLGEQWAHRNKIPVKVFPALWKTHGKSAGPIRNREMATYLTIVGIRNSVVLLFPGGYGTNNMNKTALELSLRVEWYVQPPTT